MGKEYKAIHPAKYYRDFLSHNIRPDGREFSKFRSVAVNLGSISTADGSAIVKFGNTTVVCGIKAELAKPKLNEPSQGYLIPNVELSPLCSSKFRPGPPSDQAQVATQFLADVLFDTGCIRLNDLCIVPDKLVWVLYCDLVCLDYDGAVKDACVAALIAALKSTYLPKIEYEQDLEKIKIDLSSKTPLNMYAMPAAVTFVTFESEQVMTDPTNEEEELCSGSLTIVACAEKVSSVHKPGGIPLTEKSLHDCMEQTKQRSKFICDLINTAYASSPER